GREAGAGGARGGGMNRQKKKKNRRHQRAATASGHAHQQASGKARKRIERINHSGQPRRDERATANLSMAARSRHDERRKRPNGIAVPRISLMGGVGSQPNDTQFVR